MSEGIKLPGVPAKATEVPPHLVGDYCLRCSQRFKDHSTNALAMPNKRVGNALWGLGMIVCLDCLTEDFDIVKFTTLYIQVRDSPDSDPEKTRPKYVANQPHAGYVCLHLLDNGIWRVSLRRGFPEIWSAEEIENLGGGQGFCYSRNYELFGPVGLFKPPFHTIVRTEFLDLRCPRTPE